MLHRNIPSLSRLTHCGWVRVAVLSITCVVILLNYVQAQPQSKVSRALARDRKLKATARRPVMPAMAPPSVEYFPEPGAKEKQILIALDQPVNFEFVDATLDEVRQYVIDTYKIDVFHDKPLLEESIDPDSADVNLVLTGVTLRIGLTRILERKEMALVIRDNALWWHSKEYAREHMLTRIYPVRDLVSNLDTDYELLRHSIIESVGLSKEWKQDGNANGAGTISILPPTGSLVIRQTWESHVEVLELLRNLRGANAEVKVKESQAIPLR